MGLVVGTRPEAIKLAPVARALLARGAQPRLVLTGQHPGLDPADHGLEGFPVIRLRQPGIADPAEHAERIAEALLPAWRAAAPAMVLVQGDTSSALGGARAAVAAGVPLAHVEAGLRTHDPAMPWPEESFRVEIDRLAQLLFAPTTTSAANLAAERVAGEVHITGNSGIDALAEELVKRRLPPRPRRAGGRPLRLLVTCHRRENWDERFTAIAGALIRLAAERTATIDVVLHPNPRVGEAMFALLGSAPGVRLLPPLSHWAMIEAINAANLVLSDSGGVQEEAPMLGVPLLVLRDKTERPEGIASGNARLVGSDPTRIADEVRRLAADRRALAAMASKAMPFGDGRAAPRIAAAALDWLAARPEGEAERASA